jgi:hypothetical protein
VSFEPGEVLTHRRGGTYVVILTPDICTLEKTREPAYAYLCVETTKKIHVRCASESEALHGVSSLSSENGIPREANTVSSDAISSP